MLNTICKHIVSQQSGAGYIQLVIYFYIFTKISCCSLVLIKPGNGHTDLSNFDLSFGLEIFVKVHEKF